MPGATHQTGGLPVPSPGAEPDVSAYEPVLAERSLAVALRNCTVGVALFDADRHCAAANAAFSSMSGLPSAAYLGKTVRQIFAAPFASLEQSIASVQASRIALRCVHLDIQLAGSATMLRWIADLFPLRDLPELLGWIGIAFSEAPRKSALQQQLLDVALPRVSQHPGGPAMPSPRLDHLCGSLLHTTFRLLHHSLSLRRQVSELRLATSTWCAAWPVPDNQPKPPPTESSTLGDAGSSVEDLDNRTHRTNTSSSPLSSREMEVLRLLANGKSNKEIAQILALSPRTVEVYRARLMRKLRLYTLADLIRYAIRHHLVEI